MSAPPYMPLYVGDYLADTTHLTTTEHGAYVLLLACMWRSGGSLPADDAKLARFAKLTSAQWTRIKPTIMDFFTEADGVLTQGRLSRELTKHSDAVRQRREAGSNGGKAKSLKDKARRVADAMPSSCQPEPEPEPEEKEAKASSPVEARAPARPKPAKWRRVPESWAPSEADLAVGAEEAFTPGEIERELAKFRDHEFQVAHSDASATFRKWLRTAAERRPRNMVCLHDRPPPTDPRQVARHANYAASDAGFELAAQLRAERDRY